MAFDGIATACILHELSDKITGGRIDKITQPRWDEVNITTRANGQNSRLLISANTMSARVHLTDEQKESPEKAPMFCMLLRKHLLGGRIIGFEQPDFERVLKIKAECYDELGVLSVKTLIAEIMGKHSNVILTDNSNGILGSLKHVDFTVSSLRQLLPGMKYEMPPSQLKRNPLNASKADILKLADNGVGKCDKFILETFTGIGPLNAREIAFMAIGDVDKEMDELSAGEQRKLADCFVDFFDKIKEKRFYPILLYKKEDIPWDFNATEISQYGNMVISKNFGSISAALDVFIKTRFSARTISEKTAGLQKFLDNNMGRCKKKILLLQKTIEQATKKEQYKMFGDLLTTNLHLMPENATSIEVENYYDNMECVEIPLIFELSPIKNAQRYYKLYQKSKTAEIMAAKQLEAAKTELLYLESVSDNLSRAECTNDIFQIEEELLQQGYKLKSKAAGKSNKKHVFAPHSFYIDGFEINVGKNNMQNDDLTFKASQKHDLWFHVKSFPGSHTILKAGGKSPSDDTIAKVAKIAAYFSKAKDSANVPVDFTEIKNVKKPKGAKPGMVIYENYSTINVKPEIPKD